jgi:transposase, IS5 family
MRAQQSFSQMEFRGKKKVTRRERFLCEMNREVPWEALVAVVEPFYPKGERGRPPIGLERMLRVYFLQNWFALADEAVEDAIYDSQAMREFLGLDLGNEPVPDATTLLKFRRLLVKNSLTQALLDAVNVELVRKGKRLSSGTIVDATIIAAPSSTKNRKKKRDPEMHQTKKGNMWHFGMKAHLGVDAQSGLVHSVESTPANTADVAVAHKLLHGREREVYADAGYQGMEKRGEVREAGRKVRHWRVAEKAGKIKAMAEGALKEVCKQIEHVKAQVRARVEHPFHIVKNLFRHRKVRYRGLRKNAAQIETLFALANIVIGARRSAA